MRKFERISKEQFEIDVPNGNYEDIIMPVRNTAKSAGYDFHLLTDISIRSGKSLKIPLGIKVAFNEDEFLGMYVRSSVGIKHNVRLINQVGIFDADYYNNPGNEGHMWVCLYNHSDVTFKMEKGDRIVQCIFQKFLVTDDDNASGARVGGMGSTNEEESC